MSYIKVICSVVYHVTKAVYAVVGNILVVGALFYSLSDLKTTHIYVQSSFMWKHASRASTRSNTEEASKSICCAKGEGAVTSWLKKLDYKSLNNQTRSGRPLKFDTEAVFQTVEANPECTRYIGISQSRAVCYLEVLSKSVYCC